MFQIKFLKEENRAVVYNNENEIGTCLFKEQEDTWNIIHTVVKSEYQGQGIARNLENCVQENALKYKKKLIATCSYAKKVLELK